MHSNPLIVQGDLTVLVDVDTPRYPAARDDSSTCIACMATGIMVPLLPACAGSRFRRMTVSPSS